MLYGTPSATADDYIRESFSEFGRNIYTYGPYYSIQNIKNASTANRLMYIMLVGNNTYGDHALLGYAWSCMTDETRPYRNFYLIKVCDGINTSGRYLDQSLIENDTYVEIYFP